MALETETEVEQINTVTDDNGNYQSPANERHQKATRDALGNQPGIGAFEHTTGSTTAEQLAANPVPDGVEVLVQAQNGNTDPVKVGNSAAQPVTVTPGDAVSLAVEDTSAIYVRALTSGDAVAVLYEESA